MNPQVRFVIALLAVALFGWLDYITGPDIGFSLFYLLPIAGIAWDLRRLPSIAIALVAVTSWFFAHYFIVGEIDRVLLWNTFTRLVIYLTIALLVQEVRQDRRQLQAALLREADLARTDWLTSLANSRWFDERLKEAIESARRSGAALCIAYFDLDGFKRLNDVYGHRAGDDVLRDVGLALRASVRNTDLAGRLGGDEFAVIFSAISRDDASEVARRIQDRIAEVAELYPDAKIGASIGMACFDRPSTPDEVIRIADHAMYRAKSSGKGTIVWADDAAEISPPVAR